MFCENNFNSCAGYGTFYCSWGIIRKGVMALPDGGKDLEDELGLLEKNRLVKMHSISILCLYLHSRS